MFEIELSPDAIEDLRFFKVYSWRGVRVMKTVVVSKKAKSVNALLEEAKQQNLIVRAADGTEFILAEIDDFNREIELTRQNERLMELLEERARQTETVSLAEAKKQLGID